MISIQKELEKQGHRVTFVRNDEVLGRRECTIEVDDPGYDGTEFAHSAYFRGGDHAIKALVAQFNKILSSKDKVSGVCGNSELQNLRVRLREIVKQVRELQAQLEWKEIELNLIFRSICAECTDEMRKVLYSPKPKV